MTTKLASDKIFCSSCFNQQPEVRHVDFDAACDRGYGKAEAVQIAYDDLVLCENCLREGMMVLGIEDSAFLKAENEDLIRKLDVERKRRVQAQRYSDTMEEALQHRADPVKIDHRKKPRILDADLVA
jgi:hypothetical protein